MDAEWSRSRSLDGDASLPLLLQAVLPWVSGKPRSKLTACNGDTVMMFWTVKNHSRYEFRGQPSPWSHHGQGKAGGHCAALLCGCTRCFGLQQAARFQAMCSVSQICSQLRLNPGLSLLSGAIK